MNWSNPPGTENQPGFDNRPGQDAHIEAASPAHAHPGELAAQPPEPPASTRLPELRIAKSRALPAAGAPDIGLEVFTLTLGQETIELLPLKNWGQLDHFKWTARGKLPAEPAGLEITAEHVRVAGETIALHDPAGCAKLERLFNDWLRAQRETLELTRKKAHSHSPAAAPLPAASAEASPVRYSVEVDKRGQVHIHCAQGRETVASIGLTLAGFHSLHQQGLMRKPRNLATGALHDWVELEGELFSFEKGRNDAARLEQTLNECYRPAAATGFGKAVAFFLNAASSTGFDIQFPVTLGGVLDNHRYHLNDQSLEVLQDPQHCGLLHPDIIIKFFPPNLVFKQKTQDGGERYFSPCPENTLTLTDEEGTQKVVHLSQPLVFTRLSPAELTAVFNHPAINRHSKAAPPGAPRAEPPVEPVTPAPVNRVQPRPAPPAKAEAVPHSAPEVKVSPTATTQAPPAAAEAPHASREVAQPSPNLWLTELLAQPVLPHDWFACLTYSKMAERFGNSSEGKFGPAGCWFISLGEQEDIDHPAFKGIVLTAKGSLGFLNERQMARFYNGIAFIGTQQYALEGIQVGLLAVGLDARERVVFIVSDDYRARFGVPEATLAEALDRLEDYGAVILSAQEVLTSLEALDVVWTAPTSQADPNEPQAGESGRPSPSSS